MDSNSIQRKRPIEDGIYVHCDKRLKQTEDKLDLSTFDFTEKTWKEDFVLIVENRRLNVTKAVLAHASPVFDRMFQGGFKEKNSMELELPGKKVEDVTHFLRSIYPDPVDVSEENVNAILPLAEEYQVSNLKSKCETYMLGIVSKTFSSDKIYNMLQLASMYNMTDLLERCIEIASEKTYKALRSAEKKKEIPPVVKCRILEKMVLKLQHANFLKVLHSYYTCDLKRNKKLRIEDYAQWDGKSLKFTVAVNRQRIYRFQLFDLSVEFCLRIGYGLSISIDQIGFGESGCTICVYGKVVVKNVTKLKEDFTLKFEKGFTLDSEVELEFKDTSRLSSADQGYIYNGKFDVEVHLLAEKDE